MELNEILNCTAERIVADGTRAELRTVQAMAAAARGRTPGAADALVDLTGSEIARLRAFGVVYGVLLRDLPADARTEILSQLLGTSTVRGSASGAAVPHPTPQRDVGFPRRRHGEGGQSWFGLWDGGPPDVVRAVAFGSHAGPRQTAHYDADPPP